MATYAVNPPPDIVHMQSELERTDVTECLCCWGTYPEDEICPTTGLCADCQPTLEFLTALDDEPLTQREWWRRAHTALK